MSERRIGRYIVREGDRVRTTSALRGVIRDTSPAVRATLAEGVVCTIYDITDDAIIIDSPGGGRFVAYPADLTVVR